MLISTQATILTQLVDDLNFSEAAKHLNMTQPAVSIAIKKLEEQYGVKVFNRIQGTGLVLTPEGAILDKYARRMVQLEKNMIQSLENAAKHIHDLVVGITPTAEENLVPLVFAQYSNLHPDTHIRVISDTIKTIYEKLKIYEVDLAIIEGRINDIKYRTLILDTDFLCVAVSPLNPLAKKQSITLAELKNENLILRLPNSGTRLLFEDSLAMHRLQANDFNIIMEIGSIATIKELVQKNYGVSIIANSTCVDEVQKKKLILLPIENMPMIREINLIFHRDFRHPEILSEIQTLYHLSRGKL